MKKALLYITGIGLLAGAVYWYLKVQTNLLKDFTYKIIGFRIQDITMNNLAFTLKFRFNNQSSIEATIKKMYADVYVEGKNVGFITDSLGFIIPAKGSSDINLYFSITITNVISSLPDLITAFLTKKDLAFALKGNVTVKSGIVTATLPVEYDNTVKKYLSE